MGLHTVVVQGPGVEFHLLGQQIGDYAKHETLIVRRAFPVVLIAIKGDKLVRFPFGEDKGAAPDGVSVKGTLAEREGLWVLSEADGFLLNYRLVQEVFGQDPHAPGAQCR